MKRLFLMGPIGCGKSTMIRTALGNDIFRAGGFLTVRITEGQKLLGFELASPRTPQQGHRFLSFENGVVRNDEVFSDFGVGYLQASASFTVADEFGGMELLVDDFYKELLAFLQSGTPCIGVLKTRSAAERLAEAVPMGDTYFQRYRQLLEMLQADPHTQLLSISGWQDTAAAEQITHWVNQYVRR